MLKTILNSIGYCNESASSLVSAIAGIIRLDGLAVAEYAMKKMLASMQHCGPDQQQYVVLENAAFGQALLATTPEALNELQPWTDSSTGCIVVTDSRLDQREELAASLGLTARSIDFIGDAELIFAAYQNWGEACAEKLLGDFTFAVWNPDTKHLFCARDQLGVRPFYYHRIADEIFAFATTSEALRCLLQKPVQLDEGRLVDALTDHLEGYDHTSTFFYDVKRLAPAHFLSLELQAAPKLHCYWQPLQNPPSPFPHSEKEWLEQLERLFVDAVHCRLRSHLPISSMLSGGLDSSAVVAVACEKLKHENRPDLSTFSAVSDDVACAETLAIRTMQAAFPLRTFEINPQNSLEMMQAIAREWPKHEEPFEAINTLVHAQYLEAHQNNIRIMLDGIDADGLLAEGDYLHDLARTGQWRMVWHESRAGVRFWGSEASLLYFLRPLISEFLIPMPIRRFVRFLRKKFFAARHRPQALISPDFARQVDLESRYQQQEANSAESKLKTASGQQGYSVVASSNCIAGVERYQRQASQYSIEPRHPFLDRRLVEFCAWLPSGLRLRDGYPKWALRTVMDGRLPKEIAWRRGKEHLGWPFNKVLWQQAGKSLVAEPLHPWLDKAVLGTLRIAYQELATLESPGTVSENLIEPLLMLSAVNIWLNKVDKTSEILPLVGKINPN